jgi:hypothetical protein
VDTGDKDGKSVLLAIDGGFSLTVEGDAEVGPGSASIEWRGVVTGELDWNRRFELRAIKSG